MMNMRFWISLLLILVLHNKIIAQTQWPINSSDNANYNVISAVFGEIHSTGSLHFHEGIDIYVPPYCNVRSIQDNGTVVGGGSEFVDIKYGNSQKVRLYHVNYSTNMLGQYFDAGQVITTTKNISHPHLHFEMWVTDGVGYDRINPLNNDYGWHLPCPVDNYNPQINDIFVMPVTNQQNTNIGGSFILQNNTGGLSVFNNSCTKIHLASTLISNGINYSTGVVTNYPNDKLVIFGNVGFIANARDVGFNSIPGPSTASGQGLTVKNIKFSIDNQDKYLIDFDGLLHSQRHSVGSIFHTEFNTLTGTPALYGNNDFIELYTDDNVYTYPEKTINNIQSNGIWDTRANNMTNEVFNITPTTLTYSNDNALYSDGEHSVQFHAEDAYGNDVDEEIKVIIDNFRPYIKKVKVSNNVLGVFYNVEWQGVGTNINKVVNVDGIGNSTLGVNINVTTSEPMNFLSLVIIDDNNNSIYPTLQSQNAEHTEFLFNVNAQDMASGNTFKLNFTGNDLANNPLEAISKSTIQGGILSPPTQEIYTIPIRQTNTTWLPTPNPGTDTYHEFKTGCTYGNKSTNNTVSSPCLEANFSISDTVAYVGDVIQFTDLSYGNPGGYYWTFDNSNEHKQDIANPTYVFNQQGIYNVQLQVNEYPNLGGDFSATSKQIKILSSSTIPYADFLIPSTAEVGQVVNIVDQSNNSPDTWHWEFIGTNIQDNYQQNPQNIIYDTPGNYTISLTVTNQYGSDTLTKSINITEAGNLNASMNCDIFPEQISPGQSTAISVSLDNAVYNPYSNITFQIDYGDGTNEQITTNQINYTFFHTFNSPGIFNVNITAINSFNQQIDNCTSTVNIYDVAQPIQASININPTSPVFGSNITFSSNTNAYGNNIYYEWHLYKYGFSSYEDTYIWGLDETFSTIASAPGTYKVTLNVSDNTGRQSGYAEAFYTIDAPFSCIYADVASESEFGDGGNIIIHTNCFFSGDCCAAIPEEGIVTDIRLTLFNKWKVNVGTYYSSYDDPNFQVINTNKSYDNYYIIVEAWDRFYYPYLPSDFMHSYDYFSPGGWGCIGGTNPHDYFYYDKVGYLVNIGNCKNNKYLCGDINTNITYEKSKIFAANNNGCSSTVKTGKTVTFKASNEVTMRKGFTAEKGTDFTAKIYECVLLNKNHYTSGSNNLQNKMQEDSINFDVYPNPSNGIFNINLNDTRYKNQNIYYEIYNSLGNKIKSISNIQVKNFIVDISNNPKGLYYIRFYYKNKYYTKKIMLTK